MSDTIDAGPVTHGRRPHRWRPRLRWGGPVLAAVAALAALAATLAVTPTAARAASPLKFVLGAGAAPYGWGQDDLLLAISNHNNQNRVYYTRGNGGVPYETWREVPGGGLAVSGTPATVRGTLETFVVVTGLDRRPWIQVFHDEWNGNFWNAGWQQIPGAIEADGVPQVAYEADAQRLHVTMVDVYGQFMWQFLDTTTWQWSGWIPLNLPAAGVERYRGVAVADVNGEPMFAVTAANRKVYAGRFGTWGVNWAEIPGGVESTQTPAIAVSRTGVANVVVASPASIGNPAALWYQAAAVTGTTMAGLTWRSSWDRLPGNGQFWNLPGGEGPAVTRTPTGKLHVYYIGADNALWSQSFHNPTAGTTALHPSEGPAGWHKVPGTDLVLPPNPTQPQPTQPQPTQPSPTQPTPTQPTPSGPNFAFVDKPTYNKAKQQFEINFRNFGGTKAGAFQVYRQATSSNDSYLAFTGMEPGATQLLTQPIGDAVVGQAYVVTFNIDAFGSVAETNESNNSYTFTFRLDRNGDATYPLGLGAPAAP